MHNYKIKEVYYLIKSITLRIYPNKTQLDIIDKTLYACFFVKNEYLGFNFKSHEKGEGFISGYDFSKIINKLKKIKITNGDQLPDESDIISGRIIRHYNKYYVMFIYNDYFNDNKDIIKRDIKLGIDLGVKNFATIYDGTKFYYIKHFKDLDKYKKLNDRKTKLEKVISKKAEYNYGKLLSNYLDTHGEAPNEKDKKELRKESYNTSNIRRLFIKINKIKVKLSNIADDYIKKLVDFFNGKSQAISD